MSEQEKGPPAAVTADTGRETKQHLNSTTVRVVRLPQAVVNHVDFSAWSPNDRQFGRLLTEAAQRARAAGRHRLHANFAANLHHLARRQKGGRP